MPPQSFDLDADIGPIFEAQQKPSPPPQSVLTRIHTGFTHCALNRHTAIAIYDGECTLTFGELDRRSTTLAKQILLSTKGDQQHTPVALCLDGHWRSASASTFAIADKSSDLCV